MATAETFIKKALTLIGVRASETDLTTQEQADAIETLNDMMLEYSEAGISVGYTVVSAITDTVTVYDWANSLVKTNLAVRLAPEYDRRISPELAAIASNSFTDIMNRQTRLGPVKFPGTLPVGSGNRQLSSDNKYFEKGYDDIALSNGDIYADDEGEVITE
ncbi:MAG: hypothetical protein GY938_18020 [Ketobacter sp.]|nr:hypothetical protein [Ketobacter sp.]